MLIVVPYFHVQVLDHERVRHQFNVALDSMNSAVEGGPTAAASRWSAGVDPTASAATMPPLPTAAPSMPSTTYTIPASELTLRDLVQRFAEESGVAFVPKFGRFHDGLQVRSDPVFSPNIVRIPGSCDICNGGGPMVAVIDKTRLSLQVYSFAGISVVLENTTSVVRAQLRDRWAPVALETLLQQAKLLA